MPQFPPPGAGGSTQEEEAMITDLCKALSANRMWIFTFIVFLLLTVAPARTWVHVSLGDHTLLKIETR